MFMTCRSIRKAASVAGAFYSGRFKDGTQGTALTIKHDQAGFCCQA